MDKITYFIKPFILPPGGIILLLLLLLPFLTKRLRWIVGSLTLFFYLISTKFIGYTLAQPLQNFRAFSPYPQVVVVLGGGVGAQEDPIPLSPTTLKRVMEGVLIARKYHLPLIFTGGGFARLKEGKAVQLFLTRLKESCQCNFPFYIESNSLTTYQNAQFTGKLLEKLHLPKDIILVTSGVHLPRATAIFQKMGFQVTTIPVNLYPSPFPPQMDYFFPTF